MSSSLRMDEVLAGVYWSKLVYALNLFFWGLLKQSVPEGPNVYRAAIPKKSFGAPEERNIRLG